MNEYIDKKQAIDRIASCYCMDCEHSNGVLCRACEHKDDMDLIDDIPSVDVISKTEVLELIESFKVESTHELSKSDFGYNDTLRLLQDAIRGVVWKDVL